MKILTLTRHYWPDATPGARLHRVILEHLVHDGHDVTVFTAHPSHHASDHQPQSSRERRNGVEIVRTPLLHEDRTSRLGGIVRALNIAIFLTRAFFFALRNRHDMVLVSSCPPVAPGLTAWFVSKLRGSRYIYHCLDIQPESSAIVGKVRIRSLVTLLRWLDRIACRGAASVVTLSEEMAATLRSRGWSGDTIQLINNFHTETASVRADMPEGLLPELPPQAFQIVFAGNMGAFQGLDLLIDAAHKLTGQPEYQFLFLGAGQCKESLEKQAGTLVGKTVHFLPFQTVPVASAVMRSADLAVVSLLPEVFATAVPSKTMMYLQAGCPILALIEPDCELAALIKQQRLGTVPESRTAVAVATSIVSSSKKTVTDQDRARLIRTGDELFGQHRTLRKWSQLINSLETRSGALQDGTQFRRAA